MKQKYVVIILTDIEVHWPRFQNAKCIKQPIVLIPASLETFRVNASGECSSQTVSVINIQAWKIGLKEKYFFSARPLHFFQHFKPGSHPHKSVMNSLGQVTELQQLFTCSCQASVGSNLSTHLTEGWLDRWTSVYEEEDGIIGRPSYSNVLVFFGRFDDVVPADSFVKLCHK